MTPMQKKTTMLLLLRRTKKKKVEWKKEKSKAQLESATPAPKRGDYDCCNSAGNHDCVVSGSCAATEEKECISNDDSVGAASIANDGDRLKERRYCGRKETLLSMPYSTNDALLAPTIQDSAIRTWDVAMHVDVLDQQGDTLTKALARDKFRCLRKFLVGWQESMF